MNSTVKSTKDRLARMLSVVMLSTTVLTSSVLLLPGAVIMCSPEWCRDQAANQSQNPQTSSEQGNVLSNKS